MCVFMFLDYFNM